MEKKLSNIVLHYDEYLSYSRKELNSTEVEYMTFISKNGLIRFWNTYNIEEVLKRIITDLITNDVLWIYFDYSDYDKVLLMNEFSDLDNEEYQKVVDKLVSENETLLNAHLDDNEDEYNGYSDDYDDDDLTEYTDKEYGTYNKSNFDKLFELTSLNQTDGFTFNNVWKEDEEALQSLEISININLDDITYTLHLRQYENDASYFIETVEIESEIDNNEYAISDELEKDIVNEARDWLSKKETEDESDYNDDDIQVNDLNILTQVNDGYDIEGTFRFSDNGEYILGSFTFNTEKTDESRMSISFEDNKYRNAYENDDSFYNDVRGYIEDNLDLDHLEEIEINEFNIEFETLDENQDGEFIDGKFNVTFEGDDNIYDCTFRFFGDDNIELDDFKNSQTSQIMPFTDNYFEVVKKELIKQVNKSLFDVEDRDFKITNFQILNETLNDNQIEGSFSCNIDDDYQIAQFTYQNETSEQDEIIQIFDLDEEIDTEFEKGGEFTNQLENFLRDNIDMDLFDRNEDDTYLNYVENLISNISNENTEIYFWQNNEENLSTQFDNNSGDVVIFEIFDNGTKFNIHEIYSKDSGLVWNEDKNYSVWDDSKWTYENGIFTEILGYSDERTLFTDPNLDGWNCKQSLIEILNSLQNNSNGSTVEDVENARPVEDNNIEVELVIEGLNDANFPSPRIEFYYPHLNIETAEIVPKDKVVELLNLILTDDDYIGENYIVDDYVLKSIATDYMSFNELLSKLMEILPETDFEDNEDTLYMTVPNGKNSNLKIKFSMGAVIWNYFNDNFKR